MVTIVCSLQFSWSIMLQFTRSVHTSPEKACPFRRCSEPWPSSLPKCSRISSRRWLYVIGPPEMLTRCSLSSRRETWRPVLYIVPPTWRRTEEAHLIAQERIPEKKHVARTHSNQQISKWKKRRKIHCCLLVLVALRSRGRFIQKAQPWGHANWQHIHSKSWCNLLRRVCLFNWCSLTKRSRGNSWWASLLQTVIGPNITCIMTNKQKEEEKELWVL